MPNVDFSQLINLDDLELFGRETIVPINGTIGTLAGAISGLSSEVDDIEDNIANSETSPAESAHSEGDYIYYSGQLYKVTADIDVGDTLTVGTNITATIVADELGGGGAGGHIIKNNSGTDMTARTNLQFGGDLTTSDDSTNDATVVTPHRLTSSEMDDIISSISATGSGLTIENLADTDIDENSLSDGQTLVYDETSDKWKNTDIDTDTCSIIRITFDSSFAGEDYTLTNTAETFTGTVPSTSPYVVEHKVVSLNTTFTVSSATYSRTVKINKYYGVYEVMLIPSSVKIYGVEWEGTSSSKWARTDDAKFFEDPVAAVGNGVGSSPFDNIAPWKDVVREERTGGTMVKIPKYYYKWTRTGDKMKLQISNSQIDGFLVSPAHADRGDGVGERANVYVGAYHCASNYKSKTGVLPLANKTRAEFRSGIHALGSNIWQYDYAMFWTIMLLYLVEYGDWNSQAVIGYGCGNNTGTENMGSTDEMVYHTGTNAGSRTTYGHIRYRWIEGLWDNVYDFCDGIYFSGTDVYCIKNPANFSDTTGGTKVGTRPSGDVWIAKWSNPTVSGFEYALYPSAGGGSGSTYVCDYCYFAASGVVLLVGGLFGQDQGRGAFLLYGGGPASNKASSVGSRIQELP